jgi:acyl-CoA synthetase (AMP-forming)/AMP-acid ligase II
MTTLPRAVRRAVAEFAGIEAVVDGDVRLTYAELGAEIQRVQRALMATGIEPGDPVSIWAPNIYEWIVASMAISCAGGVLVPLNTRYKGPEAAYILGKSRARLVFTVSGFLGNDYVGALAELRGELPALEEIVVLRGGTPAGSVAWVDFLARADSVSVADAAARADSVRSDAVADILFTSGTTGRPKGAMVTHGQDVRQYLEYSSRVGFTPGARYLMVNPYFHSFGYKAGIISSILSGMTMVPLMVFELDAMMAAIERERISVLPGPPTIYQSMLDHPTRADYDLSSLALAITGAAVVPVEMIKRMRAELTFATVITAYGLTEATGTATTCLADDDPETIAHTAGRAIDGVELRIVDLDGNALPLNEPGEILIRGYGVMLGYLDDPDETARTIDPDGWLHTGDVGRLDPDGNLTITDRMKDMFIVGGFNAYPAEIENALLEHQELSQAAVIGVPDERMGEVGAAYVVLRAGSKLDVDELLAWAKGRMANFKVPRRIHLVDALPVNAAGKVAKVELRAWAAEGR